MKRLALLGMPNTGKSTLFNRITGATARVGNWPGVTIELLAAKIIIGGSMVEVVDLPGIYDLHGYADDEKVVRHFLTDQAVDGLIVVLNARQLERQLVLALQLAQLGVPLILAINMIDEARHHGVTIDTALLAQGLGHPVVAISAKYGQGQSELMAALQRLLQQAGTNPAERHIETLRLDEQIEQQAQKLAHGCTEVPLELAATSSDRLDRWLMHPILGIPLFFMAMFAVFVAVFWLGTPLQDGMKLVFAWGSDQLLQPALSSAPAWLQGLVIEGLYGGLATVASFVPVIVLFFFLMALVEDSGYLARAAFLMDALMARLGLDGRAFVMLLMGFGCNVPAVMGTRIMRSQAMRRLAMLVIPFSLCSARLQVFLFLIAAMFGPQQAPWVLMSLYLVSLASAFFSAWMFSHHGSMRASEPFLLELPPYRVPTIKQVWTRGWLEVEHFLKRATRFIVTGVVIVWLLNNLPFGVTPASAQSYAGWLGQALQPVFAPLGIDAKLTIALLVGFVAKEVVIGALAVIYGLDGDALTSAIASSHTLAQAYSFMLFCLIYTPCLSTIAALRAESRSLRHTALAVAWPLALAWAVSFVFYQCYLRFFGA